MKNWVFISFFVLAHVVSIAQAVQVAQQPLTESSPQDERKPRPTTVPAQPNRPPAPANPNTEALRRPQPPSMVVYPAQDVTGTWLIYNTYKAEFFQEGINVYCIYNVSNFKHFMAGQFISANQIRGQVTRIDMNNNCRTTMVINYTLNGNTLSEIWTANDGNCDLQRSQTGSGTHTRTEPCAKPMNQFGGSAYNLNTDMTGSWGEADWFQDGTNTYFIYNNDGFKHFFQGTRIRNTIRGTTIRINRANNCRTLMGTVFTITDAQHMNFTSSVDDGACDLPRGWSERQTVARSFAPFYDGITANRYRITNKNSGLQLGIRGATSNNGEEATQWSLDGNDDKLWEIIYVSCGWYKIRNINSGLFLAVGGASTDYGGRVVQYQDLGQADIQWRLVDIGGGHYKIQNKNSNLFVGIGAGERTPGANVVQWGDTGQEDIKWVIEVYIP